VLFGNAAPSAAFDGGWWLAQRQGVQYAFFQGEEDCYFTFVQPGMLRSIGDEAQQRSITAYLASHKSARTQSLLAIFRANEVLRAPNKNDNSAEGWGEPHGVLDGTIWAGLNQHERLAYVQSYFACRTAYLHRPARRAAAQTEHAVSAWYGLNSKFLSPAGDLPDGNDKHATDKIGALIDRFG